MTHHAPRFAPAVAAFACLSFAIVSPAVAQTRPSDAGVSLTVYSSADPASFNPQQFIANANQGYNPQYAYQVPGFAVVRDMRTMSFDTGLNELAFTDVAQFIDPTTVSFTDLGDGDPAFTILEQQFKFDLVSPTKLFDAYVGRDIVVNLPLGDGTIESVGGRLLSSNQGRLVLDTPQGVRLIGNTADVQLGDLPDGLITKPTLGLMAHAPAAADRLVRTSYQTDGLTWRADYNLVLNADDTAGDLGAWVTLLNLSGAAYPNAELKLIAGDVQRVTPQDVRGRAERLGDMRMAMAAESVAFDQQEFFEYHLYTLPRRTTVHENTTQQIALFPTKSGVKVDKQLVYWGLPQARNWYWGQPQTSRDLGSGANKKVDIYLEMENDEEAGLGIPLPAGKFRVYKADGDPSSPDGSLEFVGEDLIDHTPKGNDLLIKIGQAFDVTGDRVQTDFSVNTSRKTMTESFTITLKNAKDAPQRVTVREPLYRWVNWEITRSSMDYEKVDARTIHFDVEVPAEGEAEVTYTVRYTW
ncbi:MAG: DUF4139 domain-containing protein [Planctomycetota bacterium]